MLASPARKREIIRNPEERKKKKWGKKENRSFMRRTRSYPCTLLFQSQFNFSLLHFEAVLGGKSVEGGEWNRRILLKSLLEVCGVLCENEAVCVGHF